MKSLEYLKKHMERLKEKSEGKEGQWRDLAKKTGVSEAYWFKLVKDDDLPPTLERAKQVAMATEMQADVFVDLVFRDRLIRFLEKEGINGTPPTPNIKRIIELLQKWNPEEGDLTRYIMSTKPSLTGAELQSIIIGLRGFSPAGVQPSLTSRGKKEAHGRTKKRDGGGKQRSAICSPVFAGATTSASGHSRTTSVARQTIST